MGEVHVGIEVRGGLDQQRHALLLRRAQAGRNQLCETLGCRFPQQRAAPAANQVDIGRAELGGDVDGAQQTFGLFLANLIERAAHCQRVIDHVTARRRACRRLSRFLEQAGRGQHPVNLDLAFARQSPVRLRQFVRLKQLGGDQVHVLDADRAAMADESFGCLVDESDLVEADARVHGVHFLTSTGTLNRSRKARNSSFSSSML